MRKLFCLFATLVTIDFYCDTQGAELSPKETAFFETHVRPLLVKHCYDCHSRDADKIKGGLRLDTREAWMAGGDSGAVIKPGNPRQSLLMETVNYADPDLQMPPKYKLEAKEISVLHRWIEMGAPDPRSEGKPISTPESEIDIEAGRKHWSFQPVRNPAPPPVKNTRWPRMGLDRFILSKIEKAGISPAPDADRFTLIRRVTFDLVGLPPTVAQVNAFVQDPAPDDEALAKVVDRLLSTPRFGERWGRHWLDVARYADSVGRTRNVPFPYAWRYRDYVIDSFNSDKPYHIFLGEQIAGDLMPARNPEHKNEMLVATGFLALGSMDLNERDSEQFMLDRVDDQVDTLGRAVLALTTGCARCHDHKFDPLAQTDYYALAGIFASTETLSGQKNRGGGGNYTNTSLLVSLGNSEKQAAAAKPDPAANRNRQEIAAARKRVQQLTAETRNNKLAAARRKEARAQLVKAKRKLSQLQNGANGKKKNSRGNQQIDLDAPLAMSARDGKLQNLALRVRGEPDIRGEVIERGFPEVLCTDGPLEISGDQSGRLELARWLADPDHPLTSRVMVNRVWAHLFGRGIVPTVDNFGVAGERPTHPELLDHLASRFTGEGWSVKKLIREMVLSRTYRMSSDHIAANAEVDEGNELFWRMNLRRMQAEVIRDSLLSAGGMLDLKRPESSPLKGLNGAKLGKNGIARVPNQAFDRMVRSVYLPVFRSHLPGMFTIFDFAEPSMVNGRRDVTTVAPQALFLLNNDFVIEASQRGAKRILEMNLPDKEAKIRYAYAYALCRKPTGQELARAREFLQSSTDWPTFIQALFSTAEFRYIR